ncbi:hypothetical protein NDU88_000465 [Pleurodeles waltl]|uniref:Taste receptor type 2 n=1 Tax=Pleurodeles waltl TaxID=8319 RepID=A0AAV7P4A1_PLEWA|nr:hypothetical protein NDU88_000465 [Pleurodeles waltl]
MAPTQISEGVLNVIFCVVALMGNTFIVTINFRDWIKSNKDMKISNVIVTFLGVTNICLQCAMYVLHLGANFLVDIIVNPDGVFDAVMTVCYCLYTSSLWLAAWLCVYYCIMIAKWSHPSYIWIRVRFPKVVPWLLCGSQLFSLTNIISTDCNVYDQAFTDQMSSVLNDTYYNISSNCTKTNVISESGCLIVFLIHALVASASFAIFSFSAGMIITTLYGHMKLMSRTGDSFRNPRLDAHLGAMKTVTMLLILYISNYLAYCLIVLRVVRYNSIGFMIGKIVTSAFPATSSCILILGNRRLKKTLGQILRKTRCCKGEAPLSAS